MRSNVRSRRRCRLKRLVRLAAGLLLLPLAVARGYVTYATNSYASGRLSAWPLGTSARPTDMHYELELQTGGPANRTLQDGSTSWNQVIVAALTDWNQYLQGARFSWTSDSSAPVSNSANNSNTVSWSPDLFGEGWGSAIGITFRYFYVNDPPLQTFEADVFFNSNQTWDSYRGALKFSATDLRRVALHEFGHSLGLDHPDDPHYGESVSADMNTVVSNVDDLTADDIAGGEYLYNPAPAILTQPAAQVATAGSNVTFSVATANNAAAAFQWMKNGSAIAGATASTLTLTGVQAADAGSYSVAVIDRAGTTVSAPAALTVGGAVVITTQPQNQNASAGATVTLTAAASGNGLSYQWLLNGTAIPNAISPSLILSNIGALDAGSYTVQVSNGAGTATSNPATVNVATNARLVNLSTRAMAGSGVAVLTAGYVIGGAGDKQLLIRGIGPALANYNVPGNLTAATLTYYGAGQTPLLTNSAWGGGTALADAFASVYAFALPSNSLDAAMLITAPKGGATAGVSPTGSTPAGIALVELYDEDSVSSPARLINLSARASTSPGGGLLTAGFVISGSTSLTVLIRGAGPALTPYGVVGALTNPVLTLIRQSDQAVLATNTGWANNPVLSAAFAKAFAFDFAPGSADCAMVVTLPPGNYTAQVSDANGGTGIALVEVYEIR